MISEVRNQSKSLLHHYLGFQSKLIESGNAPCMACPSPNNEIPDEIIYQIYQTSDLSLSMADGVGLHYASKQKITEIYVLISMYPLSG